eukprot:m51a1_g2364 hypothetical protein (860) ;mRNA; r:639602-642572
MDASRELLESSMVDATPAEDPSKAPDLEGELELCATDRRSGGEARRHAYLFDLRGNVLAWRPAPGEEPVNFVLLQSSKLSPIDPPPGEALDSLVGSAVAAADGAWGIEIVEGSGSSERRFELYARTRGDRDRWLEAAAQSRERAVRDSSDIAARHKRESADSSLPPRPAGMPPAPSVAAPRPTPGRARGTVSIGATRSANAPPSSSTSPAIGAAKSPAVPTPTPTSPVDLLGGGVADSAIMDQLRQLDAESCASPAAFLPLEPLPLPAAPPVQPQVPPEVSACSSLGETLLDASRVLGAGHAQAPELSPRYPTDAIEFSVMASEMAPDGVAPLAGSHPFRPATFSPPATPASPHLKPSTSVLRVSYTPQASGTPDAASQQQQQQLAEDSGRSPPPPVGVPTLLPLDEDGFVDIDLPEQLRLLLAMRDVPEGLAGVHLGHGSGRVSVAYSSETSSWASLSPASPSAAPGKRLRDKIQQLEREKRDAVTLEDYARAAELHDRIKLLEAGNAEREYVRFVLPPDVRVCYKPVEGEWELVPPPETQKSPDEPPVGRQSAGSSDQRADSVALTGAVVAPLKALAGLFSSVPTQIQATIAATRELLPSSIEEALTPVPLPLPEPLPVSPKSDGTAEIPISDPRMAAVGRAVGGILATLGAAGSQGSKERRAAADDRQCRALAVAVRGPLCTALASLLAHGMRRAPSSLFGLGSLLGGATSIWDIFDAFARGGSGLVTSLEVQALIAAIARVRSEPCLRGSDPSAKFRALVVEALNARKLSQWLMAVASTQALVEKYYEPAALICSTPAMRQIAAMLAPLSDEEFHLSVDFELRNRRTPVPPAVSGAAAEPVLGRSLPAVHSVDQP